MSRLSHRGAMACASDDGRPGAFRIKSRLRRADGAWRRAIDPAAPRFGSRGEFLDYIGSVLDIAERKEAEATLQAMNKTLERRVAEAIATASRLRKRCASPKDGGRGPTDRRHRA